MADLTRKRVVITGLGVITPLGQGIAAFWENIGKDKVIWAHNGAWVADSPYSKRFPFTADRRLPQGEALWQYLFSRNSRE